MKAKHFATSPMPPRQLLAVALALSWAFAASAQEPGAGRVVFVSGPAQLVAADGSQRPAAVDAQIRQGEQIVTGADAYVHVRMIDNAFVAVRPQSRLAVQLYEYDAARPAASRIKLHLDTGNTRTVSGKGGEAAKQNYRFNTPMAAIGLRGTDYTVVSTDADTRVSVSRGAVAVTPLGDGCAAAALGPCATNSTRELAASVPHAYLQVSSGAHVPVLVKPEQDPQGGAQQNPPQRPQEPRAEAGGDLKLAASKETAAQVTAERLTTGLLPAEPAPPPELVWGRWSSFAGKVPTPAVADLLEGREVAYGNQLFGLLRSKGAVSMPSQGRFDFKLAQGEAYTVSGGQVQPAALAGGHLNIDFVQRAFSTGLQVHHAGGVEQLQAQGTVHWQGHLLADRNRSNMNLAGVVANGGKEAAYLFDKPLASGGLLGAARWVR